MSLGKISKIIIVNIIFMLELFFSDAKHIYYSFRKVVLYLKFIIKIKKKY